MHNSALRHEYQEQSKRINNGFETLCVNGKKKKKKKKKKITPWKEYLQKGQGVFGSACSYRSFLRE
jgi:hypothetical protein